MSSERLEEVTLINDSSYLHLKENDSGFQYALFDKESRDKVCDGQFDWTELEDSPIGNPLAAARHYAFSDIGIEAEKVSRVSLDILESFMDEQMAWKVGKDHYLILQTCDDGWDYTLYDKNFKEIDGGQLDMPELSMQEARSEILKDFQLDKKDLVAVDYDEIVERAETVEQNTVLIFEAKNIAEDLELFAAQFDPYEYKDNFNDSKEALDEIESSLLAGKTEGLKNFFEQVIGEEDEYSALAYECLFRIEEFEKKHFPKEPVQKEEKHSVLQELNSLKADVGERPKLPTKSREEVR